VTEREYREALGGVNISVSKNATAVEVCVACRESIAVMDKYVEITQRGLSQDIPVCADCCFLIGQVYERELKPAEVPVAQ
jgi:hypothetical protein